jgi:hypothetical protein
MTAFYPILPFGAVVVKGNFRGQGADRACAYSGRSLTRISWAGTPNAPPAPPPDWHHVSRARVTSSSGPAGGKC